MMTQLLPNEELPAFSAGYLSVAGLWGRGGEV
jgi:hypothetical protein